MQGRRWRTTSTVPRVHHLVGVHEVADILGVTRQRVEQLVRAEGFPAPTVVLFAGRRIWHREDIERWGRDTGRIK